VVINAPLLPKVIIMSGIPLFTKFLAAFSGVLHFVITFTYEPSGLNWFTWVGIGLGAFAVILLISRFRIRRKQKISISAQAGAYSTVNQHITISQDDSIQKTIQKSSPTKVCSYCGSDVETDAQFCTNCGAKF